MKRLRVTGGDLAGRRFSAPSRDVRPTSDRVRESLFGRLGDLEGVAAIDLFAGSGALGLEALSRGATSLVCVDRSKASLRCVEQNAEDLGVSARVQVRLGDTVTVIRRLGREGARFDLALVDPPYASEEGARALEALVEAGVLAPGAMVVLERGRRHPSPDVEGLVSLDERRYGETVVTRYAAPSHGDSRPLARSQEPGDPEV